MEKPGDECKGLDTPKPLESDSCCHQGALLSTPRLRCPQSAGGLAGCVAALSPAQLPQLQWIRDEVRAGRPLSGGPRTDWGWGRRCCNHRPEEISTLCLHSTQMSPRVIMAFAHCE